MRLVQGATTADDSNSHEKGLAVFGLRLDETLEGDGDFLLWPDNETAVEVFGRMLTQFGVGEGGIFLGLRYEGLPVVYRALRVTPRRQADVFAGVQTMEAAAMSALNRVH